jgi:hypothetical protein
MRRNICLAKLGTILNNFNLRIIKGIKMKKYLIALLSVCFFSNLLAQSTTPSPYSCPQPVTQGGDWTLPQTTENGPTWDWL